MLPDSAQSASLSEALAALGFGDRPVAIQNKTQSGRFLTEIHCASNGVDAAVAEMNGDVYFSVNPQHLPVGHTGGRSKAHQIDSVVSLPVDLDVKDGAFNNIQQADEFVE